jgi:hypothetical protein
MLMKNVEVYLNVKFISILHKLAIVSEYTLLIYGLYFII